MCFGRGHPCPWVHRLSRQATTKRGDEATEPGPRHEGVLLYPMVGERLAIDLRLEGFSILARSVDLGQPWPGIHQEMLALIGGVRTAA